MYILYVYYDVYSFPLIYPRSIIICIIATPDGISNECCVAENIGIQWFAPK